jgi:hypothetical protein
VEVRRTFYDYEVELPTGLWQIGKRSLKMRTVVDARGHEDGDGKFVVHQVVRVVGHHVEPSDWTPPPEKDDGRRKSKV